MFWKWHLYFYREDTLVKNLIGGGMGSRCHVYRQPIKIWSCTTVLKFQALYFFGSQILYHCGGWLQLNNGQHRLWLAHCFALRSAVYLCLILSAWWITFPHKYVVHIYSLLIHKVNRKRTISVYEKQNHWKFSVEQKASSMCHVRSGLIHAAIWHSQNFLLCSWFHSKDCNNPLTQCLNFFF